MISAMNIFNWNEILIKYTTGLEFLGLTITLSQQMSFPLLVIYRHPLSNANFFEKLEILLKQLNFTKEVTIMDGLNVNWEVNKVRKKLKKVMDGMDKTHVNHGLT